MIQTQQLTKKMELLQYFTKNYNTLFIGGFIIFWGFLGIYLMCSLNPKVDRLIEWIKSKISMPKLKTITSSLIIFLLIDCIVTGYAISLFIIILCCNK